MKLKSAQLTNHLKRDGLATLYFLTGDEPLQMRECADTIRGFARQQGFADRNVFDLETGFDWGTFLDQAQTLSLFSQKKLLELHIGSKSLNNEGATALINYTTYPPADTLLLITAAKLEAAKQKTKWFTALEKTGIVIQIYPINTRDLPQWIGQRLTQLGLKANKEVIQIIAERSEGALLTCAQEIEKLHLIYGPSTLNEQQVLEAVADSAKFEVYDWVDTVLAGNTQRSLRQLNRLRVEHYEPILLLWALDKDIRLLAQLSYQLHANKPVDQLYRTYRIWDTRKGLLNKAVRKHPPQQWQFFLQHCSVIDQMIKGVKAGNVWDELAQLSLQIAGLPLQLRTHL